MLQTEHGGRAGGYRGTPGGTKASAAVKGSAQGENKDKYEVKKKGNVFEMIIARLKKMMLGALKHYRKVWNVNYDGNTARSHILKRLKLHLCTSATLGLHSALKKT